MVAGMNRGSLLFLLILIGFFIAGSSLKSSQLGDNLSIKFAIAAMNIDSSSMQVAVSFTFLLLIFNENSTRKIIGDTIYEAIKNWFQRFTNVNSPM